MNPSFLGVLAAVVLTGLWVTSRRRARPFLRTSDTSVVAALNRAQIALVTSRDPSPALAQDEEVGSVLESILGASVSAFPSAPPLPPAGAVRQRLALLRRLDGWSRGSAAERRQAMALARAWRHSCLLPLLRRGLRDPDPLVMAEAAAAMQAFRGRSQASASQAQAWQPWSQVSSPDPSSRPRKVLRTR